MPVLRQLRMAVTQPEIVVMVVEVVGGYFFPFLDGCDCPTGKSEVILGIADGVGGAGVVEDGGDGEETLDIHIFVRVLTNDIGIGVYYS